LGYFYCALLHLAILGYSGLVIDIRKVIDDALAKKGMSAAAASRAAVGNSSLIKNMRLGQETSWEKLARLAEVLDLDFYVGPPTPTTQSNSTNVQRLGPAFVERYRTTRSAGGRVALEISTSTGIAQVGMTSEQAKDLSVKLAHSAVETEEKK